jgi:hypothetical protein
LAAFKLITLLILVVAYLDLDWVVV